MSSHKFNDRTLARPWILPLVIVSGLASAFSIPWSYPDLSLFEIFKTVAPLMAQFALTCITSVFAFMGKPSWFGLLIATASVATFNMLAFSFNLAGTGMPALPKVLLALTGLSLAPTLIWGRKRIQYTPPGYGTFDSAPKGSDW